MGVHVRAQGVPEPGWFNRKKMRILNLIAFTPFQHLETRFARALAGMVMFSPETSEIAKPSELLTSVKAYMNVLQVRN